MTDIDPTIDPTPGDGADADPLAPPDDFGRQVIAEFQRRESITVEGPDGSTSTAPPGGWPDKPPAATPDFTVGGESGDEITHGASPDAATPDSEAAAGVALPSDAGPGPTGGTVPAGADDPTTTETDAAASSPDAAAGQGEATEVPQPAASVADPADPGAAPAPSGYTWSVPSPTADNADATRAVTFSDAEVQSAIALAAWAEQLPPDTRTAFAQIEAGAAAVIPRAELDQFNAWKATVASRQGGVGAGDQTLAALGLDPDDPVAQHLARQQAEIAQLRDNAQAAQSTPAVHQNLDAAQAQFQASMSAYGAERNLSPAEVEGLMEAAVNSGIVPVISQQLTPVNPITGQALGPAPIHEVTRRVLDVALTNNPVLHSRVISGAGASTTPAATPADQTPPAIIAKKARAGSLASAPSAATPPAPRKTAPTQQETVNGIAEMLTAAMNGAPA